MKQLLSVFAIFVLINSCSKKNDPTPVYPVQQDVLGAGWTKLTTPMNGANDVFFIDANNGFLASESHGIYKSTNGGTTWLPTNSASGSNNIAMVSVNRACFTNMDSVCKVTQDGGSSYTFNAFHTPGGNVGLIDCFYSSFNTAYLCSHLYIWKSVNGGASFDTVYNFQNAVNYASLFFLNDQTGWVLRSDGIYKTTTGGISWVQQAPFASGNGYGAVEFADQNTGYFAFTDGTTQGAVYKSTNGGTTMAPVLSLPASTYYDIDFVNASTGFVSASNKIWKTSDGGATWTEVVSLANDVAIVELHFIDANHGWACTASYDLLKFNL